MTIKRVGLIGVGLMGHGIGKNILEKGYPLTVMAHRNRAPIDDLVSKGAHEHNNPLAVAKECDLVILCVTGTPQIEQIMYGEYGLMGAVREGLVIADCSTAEPASTPGSAAASFSRIASALRSLSSAAAKEPSRASTRPIRSSTAANSCWALPSRWRPRPPPWCRPT